MFLKFPQIATAASLAVSLLGISSPVNAQPLPTPRQTAALSNAEQEQRHRQQQEARERGAAVDAPTVLAPAAEHAVFPQLPKEAPCFPIQRFLLEVPTDLPAYLQASGASSLPMDPFGFAQIWLDHYRGECVGSQGVGTLVKGLSQAILSRGYVTSRVLVPEQDLTSDTLKLALIPGVVGEIRFSEPDLWGTWKAAFPTSTGELLNLRDLEQGLEQMKRVASQDVDMQIMPTPVPGISDVVITVKRGKPWTLVASVDNSGSRSTGKWQGNLSLGIDNPLGLSDIFNVGVSQDVMVNDKEYGTRGWNTFYAIPWGYWTATLSASSSNYFQEIAGVNQTFVSSGKSENIDLKLHRVLRRSQNDVLGMQMRLTRRFGRSFIADSELPNQRRNNTILELGITDRHYFGRSQLDATMSYRQGLGAFGAQDDRLAAEGGPTWRYRMMVLDANLSVPFKLANRPFRFVTTVRGQYTNDRLYYVDDLTIGSRYTVRGFDGESMLAGERGFYWRNELQVPLGTSGQSMYAGLDYGRVAGPATKNQVGKQLAGAVIGLRGGLGGSRLGSLSYDAFVGTPVNKPEHLHTAGMTAGLQMAYQY